MITTHLPRRIQIIVHSLFIALVTLSCSDDNDNPNPAPTTSFAYGLAVVSGSGETQTTFLQGLESLNVATVNNSNSTELPQYASVFTDGTFMFTPGFGAPATMGRYSFNAQGEAQLDEQIIVPGSNTFSTVEIVSETEGYATVGGGISRIVQFDPSTMRITSEIDLSEAGNDVFYADMMVRDSTLFVALNDFGGSGILSVGVIDLSTGVLSKIITDERSATPLGSTNTAVFALDTNGDIYVHGSGLLSEFSDLGKKPSGILRINEGETEFDADYFFNLTEATGFTTCYGLYHFGDGLTFTTVSENDDNFFGADGTAPAFRYYRINLEAQTSLGDLGTSVPNTFAASRTMFLTQTTQNEIVFPIAGVDEDALYRYEISSGDVAKKITSESGFVSGLVMFQ